MAWIKSLPGIQELERTGRTLSCGEIPDSNEPQQQLGLLQWGNASVPPLMQNIYVKLGHKSSRCAHVTGNSHLMRLYYMFNSTISSLLTHIGQDISGSGIMQGRKKCETLDRTSDVTGFWGCEEWEWNDNDACLWPPHWTCSFYPF